MRESAECREVLREMDSRGLLSSGDHAGASFAEAEPTDEELLASLGAEAKSENDVTQLVHVRSREEIKAAAAHLFHVGDTRVHRLQGDALEQLTQDHRVRVAEDESYLSRAVGFNSQLEIDYHALEIERGDVFVLATDGVYEHVDGASRQSEQRAEFGRLFCTSGY